MDETDQRVASLFTKKSHHKNISVMYISKYNRVLLHYSVSIAAAVATAAYIPLSTAAVYIPQSTAAAAYTPRSMFVRRFVPNIKQMMTPKPDRIL
jgi:hypothetical protein